MTTKTAILRPGARAFIGNPMGPSRRIQYSDAKLPQRYPYVSKFSGYPVRAGEYLKGTDGTYVSTASVERYE